VKIFSIGQKYDFEIIIVIFKIRKPHFMETKFKITVPKPCQENWNAMTPKETGRFCSACTKTVVDFTKMGTDEIQEYFAQNREEKVCGRFKNEQVNRLTIPIPKSVLEQKMSFQKAFLLSLFVVMGSTLFSCKNHNNDSVTGEPVLVEDTIKATHTMGMPIPPKDIDSLQKRELNSVPSAEKKEKEKISQSNLPKATLGMTIAKPIVDSTKAKKK
jgi:hypothetical protein